VTRASAATRRGDDEDTVAARAAFRLKAELRTAESGTPTHLDAASPVLAASDPGDPLGVPPSGGAVRRSFVVAAALLVASCSDPLDSLDDARLAKGRDERAFWESYDRARETQAAGDEAKAKGEFEEVLRLRPGHAASLYALAGIEHRAGRHARALELVAEQERVDRPKTRALLLRAAIRSDVEALLAAGRPATQGAAPWFDLDDAARAIDEAERTNPEETGPHLARGRVELLRGDAAAADAALGRALTIHPDHAEALVLRSVARRTLGHVEESRADLARAIAVTTPKESTLPAGEGDTVASLAAAKRAGVPRLRALAELLRTGDLPWPADAPLRPDPLPLPATLPPAGPDPLRATADLDGDGVTEEIAARRASERDALLCLFAGRLDGPGSITVTRAGRDVTADLGLAGLAACVASLHLVDADGDGDLDVVCVPGPGDPSRREPAIVLRCGGQTVDVLPAR